NQFRLVDIAQYRLDFGRWLAQDTCGFLRAVVDKPARDLATLRIEAADDFAAIEFAGERDHADRQQALAVALQRAHAGASPRSSARAGALHRKTTRRGAGR